MTHVDERPVWLLDWPLPAIPRRRILVAVDSTDSCADHAPQRQELLLALAQTLAPGDECMVWLMGQPNHVLRQPFLAQHQAYPGEFVAALAQGIKPIRGGTWLADTLACMVRAAALAQEEGRHPFLLLATDGEVFDAEELREMLHGSSVGFVRLGQQESPQLVWLRAHTVEVQRTRESLEHFLTMAVRQRALQASGWAGTEIKRFTAEGNLVTGDPWQIAPHDTYLGAAFVGGNPPSLRLESTEAKTRKAMPIDDPKPLPTPVPEHLQHVLEQLRQRKVRWDPTRLQALVAALLKAPTAPAVIAACVCSNPHCSARQLPVTLRDLEESLFCQCQALLLTAELTMLYALRKQGVLRQWRCRLEDDGCVGEPVLSTGSSAQKACQLVEDGGTWLELDLGRIIY